MWGYPNQHADHTVRDPNVNLWVCERNRSVMFVTTLVRNIKRLLKTQNRPLAPVRKGNCARKRRPHDLIVPFVFHARRKFSHEKWKQIFSLFPRIVITYQWIFLPPKTITSAIKETFSFVWYPEFYTYAMFKNSLFISSSSLYPLWMEIFSTTFYVCLYFKLIDLTILVYS